MNKGRNLQSRDNPVKHSVPISIILLIAMSLVQAGCGGGNSPAQPPIAFVSGLYQINQSTPSTDNTAEGSLIQSGNNISGVMHLNIGTCFSFFTDVPVTGTLSNTVNLTMALPTGQNMVLTLTHPNSQPTLLAGNYTVTGPGCVSTVPGTSSGQRKDFSGPWQGTLTSLTGVVSQISMTFTQGGPDVHGFFSGTGTATITGGTCFSAASIDPSTSRVGFSSQIVLDNSQPGTLGKTTLAGITTPTTLGGSVFIGSYTSAQGACTETGIVNMHNPLDPAR
jgi:hypothetical protein